MEKALGKCALCAEPFDSPGSVYVLALVAQPPEGKARPIYRSQTVCESCAIPRSHSALEGLLMRLRAIYRMGS